MTCREPPHGPTGGVMVNHEVKTKQYCRLHTMTVVYYLEVYDTKKRSFNITGIYSYSKSKQVLEFWL